MNTIIHYWAVLLAAVASMVIGSIWYGPLFGKKFMKAMGMDTWTPEQREKMRKSMVFSYIGQFIASFVMFFVLAWYIGSSIHTGVWGGVANGFGVWIGFVVPLALGNVLWGGKKELFWLSIGGMLLSLLTAGAIIGAWQ
jgi:putative Ca2+/H+ antiporter (TMEM165/GDT1 family)